MEYEHRGSRLDRFWGAELAEEGISREKVKALIKDGSALVDGTVCTKPNFKISQGQSLSLSMEADPTRAGIEPVPGTLDVVYEDADLIVINKPAGLTVHPAPSVSETTLVHILAHHHPEILSMDPERPGIVHRLDKETSGLMVCALNDKTRLALSRAFADRETDKRYLAVVLDVPDPTEGDIELPVGRHPSVKTQMAVVRKGGREARSSYRTRWQAPDKRASLVEVKIHTGRTHQIRVHMKAIGHPLVGDTVYGRGDAETGASRTLLHATFLSFTHPATGEHMSFRAAPPEDFTRALTTLAGTVFKVGITGMPGSGKSLLLRYLREAGAPVFSADEAVARLYAPGGDGCTMISARFGDSVLDPDIGGLDKRALFQRMVESSDFRREVEDMVHPMVFHAVETFFEDNRGADFAAAEIPLLIETLAQPGRGGAYDLIAGVDCPEELRARLLRERGTSDDVRAVLESWQFSREDKLAKCDTVVMNDGSTDDLRKKAESLISDIKTRIRKRDAAFEERMAGMFAAVGADADDSAEDAR